MENTLTKLPETLEYVKLPQLPYEVLDLLKPDDCYPKTDDELKQIAESAMNAADVILYEFKNKDFEITYDKKDFVSSSANSMLKVIEFGKYKVNAKNATSLVIASEVLKKIGRGEHTVSYDEFQHLTQAINADFEGNLQTAKTLNNLFVTMNNVSLDLANAKARIQHYELLYTHTTNLLQDRGADVEKDEPMAESESESLVEEKAETVE